MSAREMTRMIDGYGAAVRVGARRWALVTYHDPSRGAGHRSGWWVGDDGGGWGVSSWSAEDAVAQCERPATYSTLREALADARSQVSR